jgi:hypothetical protein
VTSAQSARRPEPASSRRRRTAGLLIAGSALSLLSLLGPDVVVRAGVVVAVATAVGGVLLAWREVAVERRAHAAAMLAATRTHGRQLTEERRHNAAVVETLTDRMRGVAAIAETRLKTIGDLTVEISTLRGANSLLRSDLAQRDRSIASLRDAVRVREAELTALREDAAEVHVMPRRTLVDDREDCLDGADQRVVELSPTDVAVALPNYEDDRRFA